MPTINTKRTFSFLAFLDNGEQVTITYESEYITEFNMISKIKHVVYKHVDISSLFTLMDSYPDCICAAVENNEAWQWEQIREKEREDNFYALINDLNNSPEMVSETLKEYQINEDEVAKNGREIASKILNLMRKKDTIKPQLP